MKNLKFVAFVVATLISSLFAQAQTTAVDSSTVGKKNNDSLTVKISSLEATYKGLQREETELISKLKKNDLYTNELKKLLTPEPSACGAKPGVLATKDRKEYKACMYTRVQKKQKRVYELRGEAAKIPSLVPGKPNVKNTDLPAVAKDSATVKQPLQKQNLATKSNSITKTITTSNTGANDSTPIRPQAETDFIKRNYGKHAYGTAIDIVVLSDDKVDVQTFQNVKSRSGKSETQWGVTVKHADGSVTEYLVSGENPADALNDKLSLANTEGNGGTAKLSVKHGDDTDGKLSPSDLE